MGNIVNIQRALSVSFLLSKLNEPESSTIILPENLFNAVVKLVDALVEYTASHVELEEECEA